MQEDDNSNLKKYNYIILVFVLAILSLGVGYAQLSGTLLTVNGNATVLQQTGIFISNAVIANNVAADMNNTSIESFSQTMLSSIVTLSNSNPNSNVVMDVTIMNNSGSTQYYEGISYSSQFYNNQNIEVVEDNRLQVGQSLSNGASVTFSAIYKYSDTYLANATTPYTNSLTSYINFDFSTTMPSNYHSITYVNFTNPNYQNSIQSGTDLIINFTSPAPNAVMVIGSSNYTYANGTLTVYSVTDNLTIEDVSQMDFPIDGDPGDTVEIHSDQVTPSNPTSVSDFLNLVFSGKNFSDTPISRIDVTVTYTSSTGSAQSINTILTVNGQNQSQTLNFRGKQTNATVTASFTGLNIGTGVEFTITDTRNNLTNANVQISDIKVNIHY